MKSFSLVFTFGGTYPVPQNEGINGSFAATITIILSAWDAIEAVKNGEAVFKEMKLTNARCEKVEMA